MAVLLEYVMWSSLGIYTVTYCVHVDTDRQTQTDRHTHTTHIHRHKYRAWNSSRHWPFSDQFSLFGRANSNLLGQICCIFPMGKPLISYSHVPAFKEWPTNFKLLFQALQTHTDTYTDTYTHARTHMRAHTHAHAHTCARAHTHTHTHTHL